MSRTRVRYGRIVALLVACVLAFPVGRAVLGGPAQARSRPRVVVVAPGDTLWGIAQRYGDPGADPRATVDAIARANGIDAGSIVPGERLRIP